MIMKIALFGTSFPIQYTKYIQHLISRLEEEKIEIIMQKEFYELINSKIDFKKSCEIFEKIDENNKPDYLFSIGGDGTLLKAITYVRNNNIPIMGINTGRLGFISSISTDQIEVAINDVIQQNFNITSRIMLSLETENNLFGTTNFALTVFFMDF